MTAMSLLSKTKIWLYRDNIILTDSIDSKRTDSVFPLCHENTYFVENFIIPENSIVLDLCTGSGIIAIFASEKANRVVAVDINPRAIEFAKYNAELNGVSNIDFRIGNLFEPVEGMKFDVVTVNPPFEATPLGCINFLHSDGGEDGTMILEKIIKHVKDYLLPNGSLQIISYIREDRMHIFSILKEFFEEVRVNNIEVIPAEKYNNYINLRLSMLNQERHLTFSNGFPIRYLYIKADRFKNER